METDELARYLESLERENCYRVDATLKEAPHELTQRVYFIGANGSEQGPYVRKFIHRESGMGAAYERIFQAQQKGKRFKHVPRIFECFQRDDLLVVVMEFASGVTLQELVYSRDPSIQLAVDTFPRICDAVTELHDAFEPPLIHRDLKPSNIMVSDDSLTIIDFGIARELKNNADSDTAKLGTRAFAPPEQFGFGQTTVRSDIYALGMILYFCLTEEIPTAKVRDRRFALEEIPASMQPVLVRATAFDPDERYPSASELKAAFIEAAATEAPGSSADERLHGKARTGGRRAAIVVGCLCVVAAAIALAVAAPGMVEQDREPAPETTSDQASIQARAESTSSVATGSTSASPAENAASKDMATGAPARNGFDPNTNVPVTIGGVSFDLPNYYEANVVQDDDGNTFYYAESGSSIAMLMTSETKTDETEVDIDKAKDSYLHGLITSDKIPFSELVSSTDFELAGYPARIVTFRGTVEGLAVKSEIVYFIARDPHDGSHAVGALFFAQTYNALFDYSSDFAKIIDSATPTY